MLDNWSWNFRKSKQGCVLGKLGCHMQPTLAFFFFFIPNECSIFFVFSCYFNWLIIIVFVRNVSLNSLSEFHILPIICRNFPKLKDINKQFTKLSFYRKIVISSLHWDFIIPWTVFIDFFHLCSHWLTSWRLSYLVVWISLEGHRILLHREQTAAHSHNHQSESFLVVYLL